MKWRKLSIIFLTLKYEMRMICTELWILLIIANELNSVWWQIGNNLNMGIGILDETQSNYWNLLRISLKCLCWQEKQTNPRHNFKVLDLITHHQDSNNRKKNGCMEAATRSNNFLIHTNLFPFIICINL